MFRDLARYTKFTGQFISDAITLPVHYFGRSIPCAGENCEACLYRSSRKLSYVAFSSAEGVCTDVELCESFMAGVFTAMSASGAGGETGEVGGLVVSATRASTRNGWAIERVERRALRVPRVAMPELLGKVARLYRLPVAFKGESWRDWFERVRPEQNDLLRAALLPFGRTGPDLRCVNS